MQNALRFAKKATSIAVTATTIAWSVGVATFVPLATKAATPGSLIKMSGNPAVYYLGNDNKRYVFPNQPTYMSWYSDFSGVQTISQSELQMYAIGGNITIRPGTKLVKITTDPKVYAVEPGGMLRWVQTEAIAQTLYGDNWASRVVDVSDAFFVNYKPGADLTSAVYPTGSLIKSASSSDIYYVDGSTKRKVTASGMTANHLMASNALTATDAIFNALNSGSDVSSAESSVWTIVVGASTSTGSGLSVALASDTPASTIQASGTAYNSALKINLTAAADGSVSVTGLTLTRQGISQDSDITGVAVIDAAGKRHGNFVSFASTKAMVDFTNDPIIIPAGTTLPVWVKTNIAAAVQSGTYAVSIAQSSDVKTTAAVQGTFPINGNGFSLIWGGNAVGSLAVDVVTVTNATIQVDIGTTGYLLSKFKFTAGANEGVKITKVRMFNNGTVADNDLMNYKLVDPNGVTLATVERANNRYVEFVLSTPYEIPEGNSRDLQVLVDVKDGSTRTAQMNIQNDYDVEAIGSETGSGILAVPAAIVDASFPIGDATNLNHLTVQAGSLTVNKSTTSPTGEVGVNTPNQVVAIWDLEAKGEAIEVQRVDIGLLGTVVAGDLSGTIKLQTESGQNLLSVSPGSADGTEILNKNAAGLDSQTLSSFLTIPSNTIVKVRLVVDTSAAIATGDTLLGNISDIYFKRVQSNTFSTVSAGAYIAGNTLTATTNNLTVTSNASYASQTLTAGQSDVKVGSFILKTNNAEGVNITSVTVRLTAAGVVAANHISNLRLRRADTNVQIGNTIGSPVVGANANTFTVNNQLNIPANTSVVIDVYANIASGASDGGLNDTITASLNAGDISGVGAVSGTAIPQSTAATLQTLIFAQSGSLAVAIDQSGAASSQHYTPGLSGVEMARVRLSTTIEGAKIQKLEIRTINGGGNIDTVKLMGTGLASDPVTSLTSGVASFTFSSGGEIQVAANTSKVLTVVVNTTPLQSLVAGQFGVIGFGTIDAIGSGSGTTVQESLTGTAYVAGTDAYFGDVGDILYFTATADAGTNTAPGYYMVTVDEDGVNLATGDLVLNGGAAQTSWTAGDVITKLNKVESVAGNGNAGVDYNVGDIVYVYDSDDNEAGFKIVTTAVASGAAIAGLGFSPVGGVNIAAAGDRVTKLTNASALVGNTMRYEEVEPVITLAGSSPSGTTSPNSEQTVGMINLQAVGGRDMRFNSLTVEKNGSNTPERYVTKMSLWNGTTKLAEVANSTVSVVGDGTNANADTTLVLCTGADPAAGEIGGITAAEAATLLIGDRITLRETAGGTASSTGTIINKAGAIGACGASTLTLTFSATMTVTGAMTAASMDNNRIHFDANQSNTGDIALAEQTVAANQTMVLTVKADTSSVKTGVTSGTVTFGVNVPGSTGPLQVGLTQVEGLNWNYDPLGTGTAGYRTEADGYPIIGNTLSY